jgi:pimeloyl-ACP methyl ester carboxylesterase
MKVSRRTMFQTMGAAGGGLGLGLLGGSLGLVPQWKAEPVGALQAAEGVWYHTRWIGEPIMDNRLLWYLSHAGTGMSDIGECLDTASRIVPGDEKSWFDQWLATGNRLLQVAQNCEQKGHFLSAGEVLLRASNYLRAALIHYSDFADPRVLQVTKQSAEVFEKALRLMKISATTLAIPYENKSLAGYFFPCAENKTAPTLIVHQGWDAWPEETMHLVFGAIRRNYNCLLFHGPGQGRALREHGLTFRHDWEHVVRPVVDTSLRLPGVDPARLILVGLSFGGALAPRAAAFEHRLRICVANPGVLNWYQAIVKQLATFPTLKRLLAKNPELFDKAIFKLADSAPSGKPDDFRASVRWWIRATMWKHGVKTPSALLKELEKYNNEPIVKRIQCQMLVIDGEGEEFTAGQAKLLYNALDCPKDFLSFTAKDTGLVHCQAGALATATQRLFDWLDEHI